MGGAAYLPHVIYALSNHTQILVQKNLQISSYSPGVKIVMSSLFFCFHNNDLKTRNQTSFKYKKSNA